MKKELSKVKKLYKKGFFHIFFSNILNKMMQFCAGIFIVRVLSKNDFGVYSYSQNIISFFLLISGLGISEGLMRFGSRTEMKEKSFQIVKYSFKRGVAINFLISLAVILFSIFGKFKIENSRNIFLLMSLFPIFTIILNLIVIYLRINLKNKEMAIISNINTFLTMIFMILGGKFFGIKGLVIGKYLAFILTFIYSYKYLKVFLKKWKYIRRLKVAEKKEIINFSLGATINNGINSLIYLIDIFLIGYIISDGGIIASYKTATLIPFALNFIPVSIMVYLYPYFSKNSENKIWIKDSYKQLLMYILPLNLIISLVLVLFSKYIITFVFGKQYIDSIVPFRILSLGYFFVGTFRIPAATIFSATGNIKFNIYSAFICGTTNIFLDIFLIKKLGSIGAAYSTFTIFVLWGVIANVFLFNIVKKKQDSTI